MWFVRVETQELPVFEGYGRNSATSVWVRRTCFDWSNAPWKTCDFHSGKLTFSDRRESLNIFHTFPVTYSSLWNLLNSPLFPSIIWMGYFFLPIFVIYLGFFIQFHLFNSLKYYMIVSWNYINLTNFDIFFSESSKFKFNFKALNFFNMNSITLLVKSICIRIFQLYLMKLNLFQIIEKWQLFNVASLYVFSSKSIKHLITNTNLTDIYNKNEISSENIYYFIICQCLKRIKRY